MGNEDVKAKHVKQFIEEMLKCKNVDSVGVLRSMTFDN